MLDDEFGIQDLDEEIQFQANDFGVPKFQNAPEGDKIRKDFQVN